MRTLLTLLLAVHSFLFATTPDFDVTVVGTSPTSMLEAIYHLSLDKRVLVVEEEQRCGGAWKTIDIFGMSNVDMGCHLVGSNLAVKEFFEEYFQCKFVCLDQMNREVESNSRRCAIGYYFSGGCCELISKLKGVIESHPLATLVNQKLDSFYIDSARDCVEVAIGGRRLTTSKLILSPASDISIENPLFVREDLPKKLFYHLYLLIDDPTPIRFTYLNRFVSGMSRAMNLTPFVELPSSNLQLIVIQTSGRQELVEIDKFVGAFKSKELLSADAVVIASQTYIYEQASMNIPAIKELGGAMVDVLETTSFAGMSQYLERWKSVMVPFED